MIQIYKDWNFLESQYCREQTAKKQIVIHHTVSGDGLEGDVAWWQHTPERIATSYIIDRQGRLHRCFPDNFWAYHLGCRKSDFLKLSLPYQKLDAQSVGIELDSWGALVQHTDNQFYPIKWLAGKASPNLQCRPVKNVYEYCTQQKYKGIQYYERYTTAQLATLRELLVYLLDKHHIAANYSSDIWNVCPRALKGETGIFSHTSYRSDKSDAHPQVELVNLLKSLR